MDTEKPLKILIVHHDSGANCAYAAVARSAGWQVSACEDTGDVVGAITDFDVDALIVDFSPDSGFEALRKIRRVDGSLPSILITAHPVDHQEAMNLGVAMILPKPPDPTKLREGLAALEAKRSTSDIKVLFEFLERCDAKFRMR